MAVRLKLPANPNPIIGHYKMSAIKTFSTADNTIGYTSEVTQSTYGNRTCVFQATLGTGDSVTVSGRVSTGHAWVSIITLTESDLQELVVVPHTKVEVTNASGQAVICSLSI